LIRKDVIVGIVWDGFGIYGQLGGAVALGADLSQRESTSSKGKPANLIVRAPVSSRRRK
jgi:hypothetical protein